MKKAIQLLTTQETIHLQAHDADGYLTQPKFEREPRWFCRNAKVLGLHLRQNGLHCIVVGKKPGLANVTVTYRFKDQPMRRKTMRFCVTKAAKKTEVPMREGS